MKVLAISLSRIGDLIMMTPTFRGLKEAGATELHVVINKECRAICPLIPWVDRWIEVDRSRLQKALGEFDNSLLSGFLEAKNLILELESEDYAAVYNLTHTRLSGWMAGLVNAEVRAGLSLTQNRRSFIASGWFQYLNDHLNRANPTRFHMADVFYAGAGLEHSWHPVQLRETEKGQAEASAFIHSNPLILIQATTSDSKKTWPIESFVQMIRLLAILHPEHHFVLLGAPFETEVVTTLETRLRRLHISANKALVSFEGALSLCHSADLLVTGDTSLKHLASATSCRILELSLGSSDPYETGVYSPDNLIVHAREACAPCPHSAPCSRPTHACAERLSPECVALAASKLLQKDFAQLKVVAEQYRDEASLFRTEWSEDGWWQALPLIEFFDRTHVAAWVERLSWQLYLEGEHQKTLGHFSSTAMRLKKTLTQIYPRQSPHDWRFVFADIERDLENELAQTPPQDLVSARGDDFVRARQQRDQAERLSQRRSIELKIVRALRTEMGK